MIKDAVLYLSKHEMAFMLEHFERLLWTFMLLYSFGGKETNDEIMLNSDHRL